MKGNGNIMKLARLIAACAVAAVAGCSGETKPEVAEQTNAPAAKLPVFELSPRDWSLENSTNRIKIAKMPTNAVIVAVNGHPLKRSDLEMMMTVKQMVLKRNKALTPYEVSKMAEDYSIDYPGNYVRQRVVFDEAIARGVVTTNDVEKFVETQIAKSAKRQRTTPERLLNRYGRAARYMMYDQSMQYVAMRVMASSNLVKRVIVDDAFAEDVHKRVLEENAALSVTNAQRVVKLKNVRKLIETGEMTFEEARERFSEVKQEDAEDGTFGEYERGDVDIKAIAEPVFALKEGGITEVIDEEELVSIYKVVSVAAEKKGEPGVGTVEPERRKLSRISLRKEPLLIVEEHEQLKKDLQRQMDAQAYNAYVDSLMTNGTNRVVYPNGRDLF